MRLVAIDGTGAPGTPFDPDRIAQVGLRLAERADPLAGWPDGRMAGWRYDGTG